MMLPELSVVRLTTDSYRSRGVAADAIGVVVLVHEDAYEVEFSRPDGTTIDWFPVKPGEIALDALPLDVPAARAVG